MYGQHFQLGVDQPGMVANPANSGQLDRKYIYIFPVPVRGLEFGLAGRVRPSRHASARSFSALRLNLIG